jgi:glutamyl-tRNA synthetase
MTERVRVRYAPSPTGYPHVGNIRTALFNWLYARHTNGDFILRIEDTDKSRTMDGALEAIFESLRWLGLDWDEGPEVGGPHAPYIQSERLLLYQNAAQSLLEKGRAYTCYCTPSELSEMRRSQQHKGLPPGYDGRCRTLTKIERENKNSSGLNHVVRFLIPNDASPVTTYDVIRGGVTVNPSTLDDFVILKSDHYPTYHLANVVDDHEMNITHVLRGDEWLPSAPRHLLLYKSLGYEPPIFAHLPIILGPDRAKLAKRHGAASLLEYQEMGYLPDTVENFLALLGWSFNDKDEIFSKDELIANFSIDRILKSPAMFNVEKLNWLNGVYIRNLSIERFSGYLEDALNKIRADHPFSEEWIESVTPQYLQSIIPLIQERLKKINPEEIWDLFSFFFVKTPEYRVKTLIPKGLDAQNTQLILTETLESLDALEQFDEGNIENVMRSLAGKLNMKTGHLFGAVRIAITGRTDAPPLFETLAALGKERVLYRIKYTLTQLDTEEI